MAGYWNRPEESAAALRGGWLHSGDIGRMDEDGYVYIVDRVKDMINVSGFKVWPAEVEQFLYRLPAVREVAVYGLPDPVKGERGRGGGGAPVGRDVDGRRGDAWCRDNIAAYKVPARVDVVDELPKSATGKVLSGCCAIAAERSAAARARALGTPRVEFSGRLVLHWPSRAGGLGVPASPATACGQQATCVVAWRLLFGGLTQGDRKMPFARLLRAAAAAVLATAAAVVSAAPFTVNYAPANGSSENTGRRPAPPSPSRPTTR
jgi:hypothetical protein